MTHLPPISAPYATVDAATYEPFFLLWISYLGMGGLRRQLLARTVPKRDLIKEPVIGGKNAPTIGRYKWKPRGLTTSSPDGVLAVPSGDDTKADISRPSTKAAAVPNNLLDPKVSPAAMAPTVDADELRQRRAAIDGLFLDPDLTPETLLKGLGILPIPILDGPQIELMLSPIGVMHLYRQLYFDDGAGIGPIEQAIAIAPSETLEIVQEMKRRMTRERTEEFGSETTLESESEATNLEEIADQVQSTLSRDMSIGISANAQGSVGVWSGGASASLNLGMSSQQSRELARTRLTSITNRSSEVVRKSYSLSVRSYSEFSSRSSLKRVISNNTDQPINYGLRRVMRKVRVKIQSLGPRLVWQLYLGQPGLGLAQSRMVMFRESDPVSTPDLPPNAPPKPRGGTESNTQTVDIIEAATDTIVVSVAKDPARELTAMVIDSVNDAQPEGKDPSAPGITSDVYQRFETGNLVRFRFSIARGTAKRVTVNYTVHYEPSAEVIQEWHEQVAAARQAFEANFLEEEFERAKRLLVSKSRVAPRPSADLRREERYEILNRMISEAFHSAPRSGFPGPMEIEMFHRYFEVDSIYHFVHPSWWRPRVSAARDTYEITEDTEPAPFGKSLGWLIQLDGDRRRNEFLNSPWLRACVPVRPGREREALRWLADHIEGDLGFDLDGNSQLGALIQDIEQRREDEGLATPGPDYVTLDGQVPPGQQHVADTYPVIDELEVLVPTDGFVYDRLDLSAPPSGE